VKVVVRDRSCAAFFLSAYRNLKNPLLKVKLGASYLAHLKEHFGDLKIALIAYNLQCRPHMDAKEN
jgi:hypothetical protein